MASSLNARDTPEALRQDSPSSHLIIIISSSHHVRPSDTAPLLDTAPASHSNASQSRHQADLTESHCYTALAPPICDTHAKCVLRQTRAFQCISAVPPCCRKACSEACSCPLAAPPWQSTALARSIVSFPTRVRPTPSMLAPSAGGRSLGAQGFSQQRVIVVRCSDPNEMRSHRPSLDLPESIARARDPGGVVPDKRTHHDPLRASRACGEQVARRSSSAWRGERDPGEWPGGGDSPKQ